MPIPLGRNRSPGPSPICADGVLERAGTIEHLDAEVHGIHDDQVVTIEAQLSRIVKLALALAGLAELAQHVALHIQHEDLVAQRVGDINPLLHWNQRQFRSDA